LGRHPIKMIVTGVGLLAIDEWILCRFNSIQTTSAIKGNAGIFRPFLLKSTAKIFGSLHILDQADFTRHPTERLLGPPT